MEWKCCSVRWWLVGEIVEVGPRVLPNALCAWAVQATKISVAMAVRLHQRSDSCGEDCSFPRCQTKTTDARIRANAAENQSEPAPGVGLNVSCTGRGDRLGR